MPTRTEHIPCPNCGRTRPIVVKGPSDAAKARERQCRTCRHPPFTPYTANIPCPRCGTDRPVHVSRHSALLAAVARICRTCVHLNNRSLTATNTDEMAVERLLAGQPVRATAAERNQAVAYLTRRKLSTRAIAERIGCTQRTVERHRARLAS